MRQTTLIVFGWLALSFTAHAASFDCAKAATKVEKLICGDAEISKLDDDLNAAYKTALHGKKQDDAIRQAQKRWMRERNGCSDVACVKGAYEVQLTSLAVTQSRSKPRFVVTQGEGYTVCESYAQFLNSLPDQEAMPICHPKLSPAFPDLKEPAWEEMDIASHFELIYEIEKILSPGAHDRPVDTYDHWKSVYQQQIRSGEASPRLRRTHLILLDNGPVETILGYEPDRDGCEKRAKANGYIFDATRTSLYLWDERGQKILPHISNIAFAGLPRELVLFQGKPLSLWLWVNLSRKPIVHGELVVNHFKKVGAEPYASLTRCRINFEMPRELYERMIK